MTGPPVSRRDERDNFGGILSSPIGRPSSMAAPMIENRSTIQSINRLRMIDSNDHIEKPFVYSLLQKFRSAAATSAGRSAIAQCPAPSITASGVPVFAAKRCATESST